MLRALGDIEKVETQSGQIKDTYLQSIKDINQINENQQRLINELNMIESELDSFLESDSGPGNKYVRAMMVHREQDVPDQTQVFQNTL